jgi:hypothetical protein
MLLIFAVIWIASILSGVGMAVAGGTDALMQQAMTGQVSIVSTIISLVISTLFLAFWCTLQASLYISLRNWKEGPQTEALAEVFA